MADNKVSISILGKLDTTETKNTIQKQLNNIGKLTDIKFGFDTKNLQEVMNNARSSAEQLKESYSKVADITKVTTNLNGEKLKVEEQITVSKDKQLKITHDLLNAEKSTMTLTDKSEANSKKALADRNAGYQKIAKYINDANTKMLLLKKNNPYADTGMLDNYSKKLTALNMHMKTGTITESEINNLSKTFQQLNREYLVTSNSFQANHKQNLALLNKEIAEEKKAAKEKEDAENKKQKALSETSKAFNQYKTAQSEINNLSNKSAKASADVFKAEFDKQDAFKKTSTELKKLQENATATNNVLKKFAGKEFHSGADTLTSSLNKLNITEDMTQKEMVETIAKAKQLNSSLNNVSKEAKATGNNALRLGELFRTAVPKFIA